MALGDSAIAETPDLHGAYPRLTERQIAMLADRGERRHVSAGDVLFREGDPSCDFFVILDGIVVIFEGYGTDDERVISVHGPGRFLGELNLLAHEVVFVTAVVREEGEVLVMPADAFRELIGQNAGLCDLILRAYLVRREILIELGTGLRILGSRFSPDTHRLREFAARNRLPHTWIDLETDTSAESLLLELGVAPDETPVVVLSGQHVLRNPSNAELAEAVGLRTPRPHAALFDLVVVGAGPAGLAAAVYGASEGLATVTIDGVATGGQAGTSSRIENYLGFPAGISGTELAERAVLQAEKFGSEISVPAGAERLEVRDSHYVVHLDTNEAVEGRTILIATGARYRKLDVARLDEFERTSVYYAATPIEANLCVGDPIAVVGGGNSAGQAALFLAQRAAPVWLLIRKSELSSDMSRYLDDRIERNPNIEVLLESEVRELMGQDDKLEELVVENTRTGERRHLAAKALFVFIGAEPYTRWLGDQLAIDDRGFIVTGRAALRVAGDHTPWSLDRDPYVLETTSPGVFAAGDVRSGSVKRVASAVGEGSMAVRLVHQHLSG